MKNITNERPRPPDMLPSGIPHITTFRTSRARQVGQQPMTEEPTARPEPPRVRHVRWFPVIAGAILFLGGYICWITIVMPWWAGIQDQWNYGSTRITQLDANVGHGGESHFIAEYNHGSIVVIELSYSNPGNTHIYTLSGMASSTIQPVVLLGTTQDTQTGRTDLTIQIEGTTFGTVLYNTGTAFSQEQP